MAKLVHENGNFKVFDNGADEIFVALKGKEVCVRLTRNSDVVEVVAPNNRLEPYAVNGLPAFRVAEKVVFE